MLQTSNIESTHELSMIYVKNQVLPMIFNIMGCQKCGNGYDSMVAWISATHPKHILWKPKTNAADNRDERPEQ
jgi:hypothetical protein